MVCGAAFKAETGGMSDTEAGMDLEDRILCPDGNCTGIIIDGKCSECGKPYPESAS
jgi:hypothetical protein